VDYITKPVQQEEMLARITTHLHLRRLTHELQEELVERERIEKVLRDTTELQTAILSNANYAIISTTPEGIITTFNPAAEDLLGYTAQEMIGKQTLAMFPDPREVRQRAKIFSKELDIPLEPGFEVLVVRARQNLANEYEWTYIHKSGRRIPVLLSVTVLRDARGATTGFLGIASDITERKQAEIKLAKQATELATVSQISTTVSTIIQPQRMLENVVDLTKENFSLYHAHIYLLNHITNTLVLTAGAGEVGQEMVKEGWQISVTRPHSLVAQAARTRRGIIANDVRQNPDYFQNPRLPQTRSELAVPLIVGEQLLGVLDVQAAELNRFTDEDVSIQTTLAAQIAVALQNARSFERSEQALQELNALTRRLTREGWEEYLATAPGGNHTYVYDVEQLAIQADAQVSLEQLALTQSLTVQDEIIGHLAVAEPQALAGEAAEIMGAVAERLSTHLENLRLTEQTETALAETRALYEVGQALTNTDNVEQGLKQTLQILIKNRAVDPTTNLALNTLEVDESGEPEWSELVTFLKADGSASPLPPGTRFYLPDIPLTQIWRQKPGLLMFGDVRTDERLDQATAQLYLSAGTLSTVLLNMQVAGRWVGQLSFSWPTPQQFNERDERLFQALMGQIATVLDNRQLFAQTQAALHEAEAQAYRLTVLNQIGTGLSRVKDAAETFQVIAENTAKLVGIDRVSVALITPEGDKFKILAVEGAREAIPTGALLPLTGTSVGRAVREQRVITVADTQTAEYLDCQKLAEQGLLSTMSAP
jgi:PAS domain S-box-containing protein